MAIAAAFTAASEAIAKAHTAWAESVRAVQRQATAIAEAGVDSEALTADLERRGVDLSAACSEFMLRSNFSGRRFRYQLPSLGPLAQPLLEAMRIAHVIRAREELRAKKNGAPTAKVQPAA